VVEQRCEVVEENRYILICW